MDPIEKIFLPIHIIAGFISIVIFWIPMFVKKGNNIHRKVGKVYVFMMWIVVITAAILSLENLYLGFYEGAAFLGFLSFITANPIWYGIAILKHKKGIPPSLKRKHILFNLVICLFGALLLGYGIYLQGQGQAILMIIFGILGLSASKDVWMSYKSTSNESNWLREHIVGMLTSAIAAYTAFMVFGGANFFREFLTGYWSIIPWVTPGVVGGYLMRHYLKNYETKKAVLS